MYGKKQLYFAAFIAIVLIALYYSESSQKRDFANAEQVAVTVVELRCDFGNKKPDRSNIIMEYNGKEYRFDLSHTKCGSLKEGGQLLLLHNSEKDTFIFAELLNKGYYTYIYIILGVLIALSLVPYNILLRSK